VLIALTGIDTETQLLPDNMTLPLVWAGILVNYFGVHTDLPSSVIGAIAGYMLLWTIYHLFKLMTGKEGMGYGDFKLLAALGAWMGWQFLPLMVLMSSAVGAVVGLILMGSGKLQRNKPMPFGPFIAATGWITLIWGERSWRTTHGPARLAEDRARSGKPALSSLFSPAALRLAKPRFLIVSLPSASRWWTPT
jgi:leader peptidase (prepilin peptidase)/N-methyltransferase